MTYPLDTFVRAIVEGRYGAIRQAPPLWHPDAYDSLAKRILSNAARPQFSDPRHVARALRYSLLPRAPRGMCGEGTAPGVVAYDWSAEPKLRGMLVMHGVAPQVLRTQPDDSNEADAWLLTIELLLPGFHTHPLALSEIIVRAWAPEWVVRLVMEQRRGCFLGHSEQSSGL